MKARPCNKSKAGRTRPSTIEMRARASEHPHSVMMVVEFRPTSVRCSACRNVLFVAQPPRSPVKCIFSSRAPHQEAQCFGTDQPGRGASSQYSASGSPSSDRNTLRMRPKATYPVPLHALQLDMGFRNLERDLPRGRAACHASRSEAIDAGSQQKA